MNTTFRILIVAGIGYYFYDKYKVKSSPLSDYKDIPVIDPDFKPILNPEAGQIESGLAEQQKPTTTTTTNYSGGDIADYFTFGNAAGTTTSTTYPIDYGTVFNPLNPFDPSGSSQFGYAGGWADSYAAYY